MKFDFFTLGGLFFWEDIFYYQGWRIQRKVHKNRFRLLDPHNVRRESGSFELCRYTLLKYISACETQEPQKNIIVVIHGFGRTSKSLSSLISAIRKQNADLVAFNYCSFSSSLQKNAELLQLFLKNLPNNPNLHFVTIGAGCLILRKLFDVCDNYRMFHIKSIININPLNSGSDFAFLASRFSLLNKIFGSMLLDITPDETLKLSKVPQEIPLFLIFSPSKITVFLKKAFSNLESFPQLSPPAETSYSQYYKQIEPLTWFPLNNENMRVICSEILEDSIQTCN